MLFKKDGFFKKSVYNEIIKKEGRYCMKNRTKLWLIPLLAAILLFCLACGGSDQKNTSPEGTPDATKSAEATVAPDMTDEPISVTRAPIEEDPIAIVTPAPDTHREELEAILTRSNTR